MKITYSILGLAAGAALFLVIGCGKQEAPSGETPQAARETQPVADAAKAAAEQVQSAVTATVDQAVKEAADQANAAGAAASTQAEQLIDKAKGLVGTEKYQEALSVVQQLTNMKLTPEQQKLVDDLKAQIQTALAKAAGTNAASALGNILGGKK
jgi:hypothetical protein